MNVPRIITLNTLFLTLGSFAMDPSSLPLSAVRPQEVSSYAGQDTELKKEAEIDAQVAIGKELQVIKSDNKIFAELRNYLRHEVFNKKSRKQFKAFPDDCCPQILEYCYGDPAQIRERAHRIYIRRNMKQCIPGVLRLCICSIGEQPTSIIDIVATMEGALKHMPSIKTLLKGNKKGLRLYQDQPDSPLENDEFCLQKVDKREIQACVSEPHMQELNKLSKKQLKYLIELYDRREMQMGVVDADGPDSVIERALVLARTPEQIAIHASLPSHMRENVETNYRFIS